ncbi:MAG: hypothetical protein ACRC46_04155 [Thermoguttaceae bacterium]
MTKSECPTSCHTNRSPAEQRKWSRLLFIFAAILVVLFLATLAAYYYRFHLMWQYTVWHAGLQATKVIPNSPMPQVVVPEDWVEFSLGDLSFSLPPDLASSEMEKYRKKDILVFQNNFQSVIIKSSIIDEKMLAFLSMASSFEQSSKKTLTLPRLRLECSMVGADCFDWSASPERVSHDLNFLVFRPLLIDDHVKMTETFFRDDIDGIALFYDKRVVIDWQSTTGLNAGYIHIKNGNGTSENDFTEFVRQVCQSMRVSVDRDAGLDSLGESSETSTSNGNGETGVEKN